ncbi:hypothetical protein DDE01_13450 [Desulfovibrio desulfuricans]|nr:hypothetical protein DDE01_13450 [Desulfovibrio desulfuricans]
MGDGLSLECEQGGEGAGRVRHLRHCGGIGTARHVDIAPAGLPVSLTVFGTHCETALARGLSCPIRRSLRGRTAGARRGPQHTRCETISLGRPRGNETRQDDAGNDMAVDTYERVYRRG